MTEVMNKETLTIDGYEFPKMYPAGSDLENLNRFLKGKLLEFRVQDFLSNRHPELMPKHIGLRSMEDFSLEVVAWEHYTYSDGEYAPGWDCHAIKDAKVYKDEILEYYQSKDPAFYNFIKDRIINQ